MKTPLVRIFGKNALFTLSWRRDQLLVIARESNKRIVVGLTTKV